MKESTETEEKGSQKKVNSAATSGRQYAAASKKYFWIDTKSELQKVSWPTRDVVIKASGMVLFILVVATIFVAGIDFGLGSIFKAIRGI